MMDLTSMIATMLSDESVKSIGKAADMDPKVVKKVLADALPSMLTGAKIQSDTNSGFGEALMSHGQKDTSNLSAFIKNVDTEDGGKILNHLYGDANNAQVEQISTRAGIGNMSTLKILCLAAPLLLSLMGKNSGSTASNANSGMVSNNASGMLGSLLGLGNTAAMNNNAMSTGSLLTSLMGGMMQQPVQQPVQQNTGSLLGSLMGGMVQQPVQQPVQQQSGNLLGSILTSLLK